jgi:hypothetical protein
MGEDCGAIRGCVVLGGREMNSLRGKYFIFKEYKG